MRDRSLPENVVSWLAEPLPSECLLAHRRLASAEDVLHVAVMPDVQLVEEDCNGVAVATSDLIYPQAVGGDIGCGILAVAVDSSAEPHEDEPLARQIHARLNEYIPSNRHSAARAATQLPDELQTEPLSEPRLTKLAQRDGRVQLGTLGRGNHFVELQRDTDGRLWAMIHSGSRGIGQAISHWHLEQARKATRTRLPSLSASSDAGQRFLHDVAWGRKYASANRHAMLQAVERTLQQVIGCRLDAGTLVETDHDHVVRERHWDREVWVHLGPGFARNPRVTKPETQKVKNGTPEFRLMVAGF